MPPARARILFVDDDDDVRRTAELLLKKAGYAFDGAAGPAEALSRLVSAPVDLVLLDLNFAKGKTSGEEGLVCLRAMLRHDPDALVVVVTGHSGLNIAVQALRNGARDFIMKPWNNDRLIQAIEAALATRRLREAVLPDPSIMIGHSESMRRIAAAIDRCAPLTASVLLTGEAGTGKTLAAMAFHRQSGRAHITCAEAAALTTADLDDTPNATLVVENIDRLPESQGPALLAWLHRAPRHNSRLIATSTRSRAELGLDRGLIYAISTLDAVLPPLAERPDDIVPLAEHFIRITCQQHGFAPRTLSPEAQALLMAQGWTDNIHALRQVVERAVILADGEVVSGADLGLHGADHTPTLAKPKLAESEKTMVENALRRHNFNVSAAAADLGLTRPALYRRMARHGL